MAKTIVLIGKTGTGKSATANMLCGQELFKSDYSSASVTQDFQKEIFEFGDTELCVIDSPGVFGCSDDVISIFSFANLLKQNSSGINLFLLVFSLQQRLTKEDFQTFTIYDSVLGEKWTDLAIVVLTHVDRFDDDDAIYSYIRNVSEFNQIIQCRFGGRLLIINDKINYVLNRRKALSVITDLMDKLEITYTRIDLPAETVKEQLISPEDDELKIFKLEKEKDLNEAIERTKKEKTEQLEKMKLMLETKRCTSKTCVKQPMFKCKECKRKFCQECKLVHQVDDDTSTHTVKPIKPKKKAEESKQCSFCVDGLPITNFCTSCGPMCATCIEFHEFAFSKHNITVSTVTVENTFETNVYMTWCENFQTCECKQQYTCFDCKKYYCRKCIKKIKHEDNHLVLDTDGLSMLPHRLGSLVATKQLVKSVVQVANDNTFFKLYFPFGFIYGPNKKIKSSTSKTHFHVVSSKVLFHNETLISIGETARKHNKIVENLPKYEKINWTFMNVSNPSSEDMNKFYQQLLPKLRKLWMSELQIKLRKNHIYLKEDAFEMFLVKTLFITEILKLLKEDLFGKHMGCQLVSEEEVREFIIVRDEDNEMLHL